jgi:membrane protein
VTGSFSRFTQRLKSEREELWRVIEVVRLGSRRLWQSGLPRMAAALSYRTIFSLIPVMVVAVVVIGSFSSEDQLRGQVDRLIEFAGLDTIVVEDAPVDPVVDAESETGSESEVEGVVVSPADADPATPTEELAGVGADAPGSTDTEAQARLDEWITDLVTRVSGLPFGALGVVGLLFLVYAALSMLIELERAFNQIYNAPKNRSVVSMITKYWTTLTLGVVFLLGTFYAGDAVANWATGLGASAAGDGGEAAREGYISRNVLQVAINLAINTGLLFLAYTTVPNTRVSFRPAIAGAALSGVAWEVGKWAFTLYVKNFTGGLEQLYGAIAIIPLFLLWVYVTWLIVLFGLQVSHSVQTFSTWSASVDDEDRPKLADPGLVLVVAASVARRFAKGETASVSDLGSDCGASDAVISILLSWLVDAGLVVHVDSSPGDGFEGDRYSLARPAETILAADVLRAGEGGRGDARASGADGDRKRGDGFSAERVLSELNAARRAAMGDRTLADLARVGTQAGAQTGSGSGAEGDAATRDGSAGSRGQPQPG